MRWERLGVVCEIRVQGPLDLHWSEMFDELELGGWDTHGLEQFALAADEAGLAYALYYPAYELSARLARRSPLYSRFPIPHAEAQAEAADLDRLRIEKTYRPSRQI